MKTKFNLEINSPCSEDFNSFTTTEKGGFCKSCQKEVIDFTTMTSKEIISYFKENKDTKTCGRFEKHQLTQTYQEFQPKKSYNIFKTIGFAVMALFSVNVVQGQKTKPATEITPKKSKKTPSNQNGFTVSGIVSDEIGPIFAVNIILKGTEIGTETDFDGKFLFPKTLKKGDVLAFYFIGMEAKEITILNSSKLHVHLQETNYILAGEVQTKKVFNSKNKKGFWKKSEKQ